MNNYFWIYTANYDYIINQYRLVGLSRKTIFYCKNNSYKKGNKRHLRLGNLRSYLYCLNKTAHMDIASHPLILFLLVDQTCHDSHPILWACILRFA
jgi:hypothetical protein